VGVSLERWRVEVDEEGEEDMEGEKWEAQAREEKSRSPPRELLPPRSSHPTKPAIITHFTSIATCYII
jgi:hypothetical protein